MKNKNLLIIVVAVVLLLLLGAAGYSMFKNSNSSKNTEANVTPAETTNNTTKSLMDLIGMGKNLRCNFDTKVADGASTDGTVYVSSGNVRGDFTVTTSDGKKEQTSMIRKGDTNYVWGTMMPGKGVKMMLSLNDISSNTQASQYVNPSQKVNYNCAPWTVDQTLFTPPANITFTDMTSMMAPKTSGTQSPTGTSGSKPGAGYSCAGITDPTAKTACENALKQSGY